MARWVQRSFILLIAAAFLVTSLGFTGLVIWQIRKENEQKKINEGLQQALQQQNQQQTSQPQEGKLEGTKLDGFTPVASVPDVGISDKVVGNGKEAKEGDTITAHYTGALAKDGAIFQSSLDTGQPFTSPLSGLIQGWQVGIPGMKEGGTRRILIPAAQAYGGQERPGIPANSDLVFDIVLIKVGE